MNTSRNIFLVCIMLLIPVWAMAQIGKTKIILSTGDTTVLVNNLSSGLQGEKARFLNRDKRFKEEQVFLEMDTKYQSLEEAALDVNKLLDKVAREHTANITVNESLGFRASQVERMKRKKEVVATSLADSILAESTALKLAELYAKFGDRPTYYINGIEVDPVFIDFLRPADVLSRTVKATNTLSGNPNGEIWVQVLPEVAESLFVGAEYYPSEEEMAPIEEPVLFDDLIKVSPSNKNKSKEIDSAPRKIGQDGETIKPAQRTEIKMEEVKSDKGEKIKIEVEKKDEPKKSVRRIKENRKQKAEQDKND
ncbi:hypothetical protein [Dysgonomonas sp. ZJ279]|uniref:hypothetical protein n=1 Tax=Dysgonomonas sp. ZJ279 TaxID=2709796 RepID=UPI0013EC354C|nr:hypothetical protein [Dysgonomonas sp. ZJ279]